MTGTVPTGATLIESSIPYNTCTTAGPAPRSSAHESHNAQPQLLPGYVLLLGGVAEEVTARRNAQQGLLKRFANAVAVRDSRLLSAFVTNSLAGWTQQQLAAARIVAGLTSAAVTQLHDLASQLCAEAAAIQ